MKFDIKKIIIIMLIFILIEIAYLVGFYSTNKESYSDSTNECTISNAECAVSAEENDTLDTDLTNSDDYVIIIEDDESATEIQNENSNSDSDSEYSYPKADYDFDNISDEQTILSEREIDCIDYLALIDSYEEGGWYCYYLYADGDCYVATIKNGHVDMFVQLN